MTPEHNPPQPRNERDVTFSPCRKYRYTLRIVWDESLPVAAFVGLNPSTADEYQDDPTIRRCKGFAQKALREYLDRAALLLQSAPSQQSCAPATDSKQ